MEKQIELTRKATQDNFVTEKFDVIKNNLLGSYDDNDEYVIPSQIIDELISLKKIKKTSFGNSIFCVGNLLGYGEIAFELLFNSTTDENGKALASLYVLEDVDKINGYLQNTIKTKLGDFSEDIDNYIQLVYDHFNVITEEDDDSDDEGKELLDDLYEEDSFILAKKQFNLALDKLLDEKMLDAYGKYFTYRISALTKLDNDFSKAIMDSFNKQYSMIEKMFLKEKNYKTLNELLDKCIEEVSGTNEKFIEQEKAFIEETSPALKTFIDNFNKINEKSENKALNMLDKSDRHKIEEILDELGNSPESTIENITSETVASESLQATPEPANPTIETKEQTVSEETPKNATEPSMAQRAIREMVQENAQATNNTSENDSFYKAFTASRNAEQSREKVVDTSFVNYIDDAYKDEDSKAYNSLRDRMSRLEKFKESSTAKVEERVVTESVVEEQSAEQEDSVEEITSSQTSTDSKKSRDRAVGNVFERLMREKQLKSNQVDSKYREGNDDYIM